MIGAAFILGLLGSMHCVGMCGPIAMLLPIDRKNALRGNLQLLSYHFGRLLTYAILGGLLGLIGHGLGLFSLQQDVSIIVGVFMILAIILPSKWFRKFKMGQWSYKLVGRLKNLMVGQLKTGAGSKFFLLGLINGLLPCGLVYMTIFGAVATGSSLKGMSYMFFFGLGTVPLMLAANYFAAFAKSTAIFSFRKMVPYLVVGMGLLFILRGMGLGIPFVSPPESVAIEKVSANASCH